jgi:hypothetical protein
MQRKALFLSILLIATATASIARADYVANHFPGGHGPLSAATTMPAWGEVELCCTPSGAGERWLGDMDGAFWALPTPGQTMIRKSPAPNTYAVAYERSHRPYGQSYVVTSEWVTLPWSPQLVTIQYDDACPLTPGMAIAHPCSTDWTPMDSGGVPTFVVGNNIPKVGLPYGDYLKDTSGAGAGSWCSFNFSDYPSVPVPPGAPNHAVAVDACP